MKRYRFAVPASLVFTVDAASEKAARARASRIVAAVEDGGDVGNLYSAKHDEGYECRVYTPDNGPGALSLEVETDY